MPGISIHVVDVAHGLVATGLRVEVFFAPVRGLASDRSPIASGFIDSRGVLAQESLAQVFAAGFYEVDFHVGDWYASAGKPTPFLDVVTYRFGIHDPVQHVHLPFKMTPWGYSCFRGGA
jgi:5-hydroxyisourate hydrolase